MGSKVITISMLNFLTAGGAIELVLETKKLLHLLFMAITTSVPNFIIFLCTVHRAAIDFHWRKKKKKKKKNNNKYSCKQQYRGQALKQQQLSPSLPSLPLS